MLFQSDDWASIGIPSRETIANLRAAGADVGHSPWDYYGLETEEDLTKLGALLAAFADRDGHRPVFTANFLMANADIRRMREENFTRFRSVAIENGFPAPWTGNLMAVYRAMVDDGVFEPALHGFTHFNKGEWLSCLADDSARGADARLLVAHDVVCLPSLALTYSCAFVTRNGEERYLDEPVQKRLIKKAVTMFESAFGAKPKSACAPGYRANDVTRRVWREFGIQAEQSTGTEPLMRESGLLAYRRNVFFEPVLEGRDAVAHALDDAREAVARGTPVVICTHSMNYISRFANGASRSLSLPRELIEGLLAEFPDLRFAGTAEVTDQFNAGNWFDAPSRSQRVARHGLLGRALALGPAHESAA